MSRSSIVGRARKQAGSASRAWSDLLLHRAPWARVSVAACLSAAPMGRGLRRARAARQLLNTRAVIDSLKSIARDDDKEPGRIIHASLDCAHYGGFRFELPRPQITASKTAAESRRSALCRGNYGLDRHVSSSRLHEFGQPPPPTVCRRPRWQPEPGSGRATRVWRPLADAGSASAHGSEIAEAGLRAGEARSL